MISFKFLDERTIQNCTSNEMNKLSTNIYVYIINLFCDQIFFLLNFFFFFKFINAA